VIAGGQEFAYYHWPYPEMPGSKPEFYERDLKSAFEEDAKFLPFQTSHVEVTPSASVTLDLRPFKGDKKNEAPVLQRLPMEIMNHERSIKGFHYWGPFRYRSHGLLAMIYGIEGI
jgi:hypothetical protein